MKDKNNKIQLGKFQKLKHLIEPAGKIEKVFNDWIEENNAVVDEILNTSILDKDDLADDLKKESADTYIAIVFIYHECI